MTRFLVILVQLKLQDWTLTDGFTDVGTVRLDIDGQDSNRLDIDGRIHRGGHCDTEHPWVGHL